MNPLVVSPIPILSGELPILFKSSKQKHELSFLVGLLVMVSLTFMIFYYALPLIFAPATEVQAESQDTKTTASHDMVV